MAEHDIVDLHPRENSSSRGRGRGRGGGGRGAGRGGGAGKSREVDLSRALSRLLRHQAGNAGIQLDREGFAPLDRVLQWGPLRTLAPTFAEIQSAVRDSDKQRFALKPNPDTNPALDETTTDPAHWLIRANQGHSIKLDNEGLLRPLVAAPSAGDEKNGEEAADGVPIPPTVVHGTYFCFWPAIEAAGGLKPMGRNHVHFSTGLPDSDGDGASIDEKETAAAGGSGGVISGMRRDAELLVYVDVARSMREAGMRWWISDNGVVLTEGDADGLVPARFFSEVVPRRRRQRSGSGSGGKDDKDPVVGVGVLWRDGVKVADLPPGLKGKVPQGKGPRGGGRGGGRGGKAGGKGQRGGGDKERGEGENSSR